MVSAIVEPPHPADVGAQGALFYEFSGEPGEKRFQHVQARSEQRMCMSPLRDTPSVLAHRRKRIALEDDDFVKMFGQHPGGQHSTHTRTDRDSTFTLLHDTHVS
jgi:hypothetical protein